jgi:NADH-quinone oxidoreductase subunit G/NADP-reducing hydrogenase subunit HndD
MVELTINGKKVEAPDGSTIMEAAKLAGIKIPSLCHYRDIHAIGACRICVVEVEGAKNLQASCVVKATNGMVVHTNSERVRLERQVIYDLLISDHPKECMSCNRNQNCELQALGYQIGFDEPRLHGEHREPHLDISPSITRDTRKCILCRRCVTVCKEKQEVGAISAQNRGFNTVISPSMGLPLEQSNCSMCGQCVAVCPTGALSETDGIYNVWEAIGDPNRRVIVQTAPAVRAALGEAFGYPCGTPVTGKMAAALRQLGFDEVFDTNFGADVTIMEEGTELLQRLKSALTGGNAVLPMITSCSPGWVKHCEHAFPNQLAHLSSAKSPHTMQGALIKSYYAKKLGVDPRSIYVVSVMPCTAKKYEIQRPEMAVEGIPDVDTVITTRELARMIKTAGIDFQGLPEEPFDAPMGISTGAADIFGVTGGVMEAALRTAYFLITGRKLPFENLHVEPIMGLETIKTAEIKIEDVLPEYQEFEGVTLKIAVTSGLAGADVLMREIEAGTSPYHFIEVMGCPGGCVSGGGQPREVVENYRELRTQALYSEDERKTLRMSFENPAVQEMYQEFLGEPCGEVAHHLLHTTYTPRGNFNELLKTEA